MADFKTSFSSAISGSRKSLGLLGFVPAGGTMAGQSFGTISFTWVCSLSCCVGEVSLLSAPAVFVAWEAVCEDT